MRKALLLLPITIAAVGLSLVALLDRDSGRSVQTSGASSEPGESPTGPDDARPPPLRSSDGREFRCGEKNLTIAYNRMVDPTVGGYSSPESALEAFEAEQPFAVNFSTREAYFVSESGQRADAGLKKMFEYATDDRSGLTLQVTVESLEDRWHVTGLMGCRTALEEPTAG